SAAGGGRFPYPLETFSRTLPGYQRSPIGPVRSRENRFLVMTTIGSVDRSPPGENFSGRKRQAANSPDRAHRKLDQGYYRAASGQRGKETRPARINAGSLGMFRTVSRPRGALPRGPRRRLTRGGASGGRGTLNAPLALRGRRAFEGGRGAEDCSGCRHNIGLGGQLDSSAGRRVVRLLARIPTHIIAGSERSSSAAPRSAAMLPLGARQTTAREIQSRGAAVGSPASPCLIKKPRPKAGLQKVSGPSLGGDHHDDLPRHRIDDHDLVLVIEEQV